MGSSVSQPHNGNAVRKPGFLVVSWTTVALALAGFAITQLRTKLPPQPSNAMFGETDEYLRQGAFQQIHWRKLEPGALAEARRLDRPVMLVMGASWSREARQADSHLFRDQDIQSFLARNFVCIRVDLDAHPEWLNVYLPLSRAVANVSLAFQIVYLDPEGQVYDFLGSRGRPGVTDPVAYLEEFVRARTAFSTYRTNPESGDGPQAAHARDLQLIASASPRLPAIKAFTSDLLQKVDAIHGGFPTIGQIPRPIAIEFLMMVGQADGARAAIDPMLRSAWVDWLDGGFFRRARKPDWTDLEFDKIAVACGIDMRVVARYARLAKDRFAERIAKNAFDSLSGEFCDSGLVSTARLGDEVETGRSRRSSFQVKEIRRVWGTGLLEPKEVDVARDLLGLRVETNPQMSIKVSNPASFDSPLFEETLLKLRRHKELVPKRFTTRAYANVNGFVVASLYDCARLWGDPERMSIADARFAALSAFGTAGDVTHSPTQSQEEAPYLGDYLAISEACLQRFLARGDVDALDRGRELLARARSLFAGEFGWYGTMKSRMQLLPDTVVPEILDTTTESLCATAIRLCTSYGRLLGPRGFPEFDPIDEALVLTTRFGAYLSEVGPSGSGIMVATLPLIDDAHAVAVGPGAISLSAALLRRVPTRLVSPALGPVRPDLQKRDPGLYIVSGTEVTGPLTVEAAAAKLSPVFSVDSNSGS